MVPDLCYVTRKGWWLFVYVEPTCIPIVFIIFLVKGVLNCAVVRRSRCPDFSNMCRKNLHDPFYFLIVVNLCESNTLELLQDGTVVISTS